MTIDNDVAQLAVGVELDTPIELYPGAPERIYLQRDEQGLWRRTAFGDLPDVVVYAPVTRTPADVQERARRAADEFNELIKSSTRGFQSLAPDYVAALAAIIAAEFGGEAVGQTDA